MALAGHRSVSLSTSVTSRSSTKMDKRIELGFGMDASFQFHLSYIVFQGNSGISENNGWLLPSETVPNSGFRKFGHDTLQLVVILILQSRRLTGAIHWDHLRSNQLDSTCDGRHSTSGMSLGPSVSSPGQLYWYSAVRYNTGM